MRVVHVGRGPKAVRASVEHAADKRVSAIARVARVPRIARAPAPIRSNSESRCVSRFRFRQSCVGSARTTLSSAGSDPNTYRV
eukprot:119605-Pleurochrysis_carterae.AAC.2